MEIDRLKSINISLESKMKNGGKSMSGTKDVKVRKNGE
jgi:hypothetical protein